MNTLLSFVLVLLGFWVIGYAMAYSVSRQARYTQNTKKVLSFIWRRYRTQIIWFAIGVMFGTAVR